LYSYFIMIQYENQRWVEYFQMIREIILKIIKNYNLWLESETPNTCVQFLLTLKLHAHFSSLRMELIISNYVTKCSQLASLSWTYSYMNLLLLLMLCLETKFNCCEVKMCQGWWWASRMVTIIQSTCKEVKHLYPSYCSFVLWCFVKLHFVLFSLWSYVENNVHWWSIGVVNLSLCV
jgi:hypothetical protein